MKLEEYNKRRKIVPTVAQSSEGVGEDRSRFNNTFYLSQSVDRSTDRNIYKHVSRPNSNNIIIISRVKFKPRLFCFMRGTSFVLHKLY